MNDVRYVLTIATGKKLYVDLAANLARSFLWWHRDSDIKFQLVTDQKNLIPEDIRPQIQIIDIKPGELGEGFSSKLFLDQLAADGQTLFVDSDCLIFGDLSSVFNAFKGKTVSVTGDYITGGEWFGDIKAICQKFNIERLPKFNGGVYYLERGKMADTVYQTARDLEKRYDEIGFVRLRNRPNDEVLMALAMQLNNEMPLIDDGTLLSDPQACPGGYHIDVIKGERWMLNPPIPNPLHQSWYPFEKVSPIIVHFLGSHTLDYAYLRECYRLKKALAGKLNLLSELSILLSVEYPYRIIDQLKTTFRPLYHKLAGYRRVKISERV
jgi:hypothetical protein